MILEYKGINIFYSIQGQGTAIVLLHGFLESSTMWNNLIPELSKSNKVICIDLLGHGQTDSISDIHTMELMAEFVEIVLKHLKIKRSYMVGHSMGGYVALAFAEKNTKNIIGLCLLNSTSRADTIEKKKQRDRAIEVVKENHKSFIRIAIPNLFRPKNRRLFSKKINAIKQEALQLTIQDIIAALEGMKTRKNRESFFQEASFKKLMIIGKKDPVLDYTSLVQQTKNTNISLIQLPDGHMSHIENESFVLLNIMHFIE